MRNYLTFVFIFVLSVTVFAGESLIDGVKETLLTKINGIDYVSGNSGIDPSTESLQTIPYSHHELHSGKMFVACHNATVASGAAFRMSFTTPNTAEWAHLLIEARSSGESNYGIYEDATVTASSGSTIEAINHNRNSSNTSTLLSTYDATAGEITIDGTWGGSGKAIVTKHFGAGNKSGAENRDINEYVLKQNSTYVISFTSEAASNDMQMCLNWYEHTDKN